MNYLSLKRTSMSLDKGTLESLALLAEKWNVSKSEVIRRAVRNAKLEADIESSRPSPDEALGWLQTAGLTRDEATTLKEEIRTERGARRCWWE